MQSVSRRTLLRTALVGAAAATTSGRAALVEAAADAAFDVPGDVTLLNNAGTHPLPAVAARATAEYLLGKRAGTFDPHHKLFATLAPARTRFAALINAAPEEIALVQSTLAAENMVVSGLDLPRGRGNVVTDALHYDGALYLYRSIQSATLQVRVARAHADGRVPLEAVEELIDDDTRLVSVSLVSSVNGHMHDLKAICDLAHARGALVYADIIQAAGAVPVDVKATNVDFCGCGSYKWLMADCGAGFLYARKDLLGRRLERDRWGFLQCAVLEHEPLATPAEDWPIRFRRNEGAAGWFEIGTPAFSVLAGLKASMDLIASLGVAHIQAHIAGLLEPLRRELPKLGYKIVTPPSGSPILAFRADDPAGLRKRLAARRIDVKSAHGVIRVSPAVFSMPSDIERFLAVLKHD